MADKPEGIEKPPEPPELTIILIGVVIVGVFIAERIRAFIYNGHGADARNFFESAVLFLQWIKPYAVIASFVFSVLLVIALIYTIHKFTKLNESIDEFFYPEVEDRGQEAIQNERWQRVLGHLESDNENEWRVAVVEADIMLNDLLDKLGYRGDTMADKLKQVEKSDFNTIDMAWEGHKVRNVIAHEGGDFRISKREAQRVIGLYEQVFKEFLYI